MSFTRNVLKMSIKKVHHYLCRQKKLENKLKIYRLAKFIYISDNFTIDYSIDFKDKIYFYMILLEIIG